MTTINAANPSTALQAANGGFRDLFDLAHAAINALENGSVVAAQSILLAMAHRADQEGNAADLAEMATHGVLVSA
jgi:hypothetical protein